ncbi:MAG: metallophosphoesterase family protein [Clostridia bacterium]|nr:metallophosphoesterase family protein [Clostridia bacterium]
MNKKALIILGSCLSAILIAAIAAIIVISGGSSSPTGSNPSISTPAPITTTEYSAMCITVSAGENAHTTTNFCWQTFDGYTSGALQYAEINGTDAENTFADTNSQNIITVKSSSEAMSIFLPAGESNLKNPVLEEKAGLVHRVWLNSLTPGKTYAYRVGDTAENKWSEPATFSTAEESEETSFLYVTDPQGFTQSDYNIWGNLIATAVENHTDIDFILNLGDVVEENTNQNQWKMFTETALEVVRNNTFVSVSGNKDKKSVMEHFTFGSEENRTAWISGYYSFECNNIHFSVLYTGDNDKDLSKSQLKWLEDDLENSTKQWNIVLMHKSPVSNANHYNDTEIVALRKQILPVIDKYNVDAVITGHDHYFFRSEPMTASGVAEYKAEDVVIDGDTVKILSDIKGGTVYFINGSSGVKQHIGKIYEVDGVYPDEAFLTELPSYSYCTVEGNRLIIKTYTVDEDGTTTLIDAWGITKQQ